MKYNESQVLDSICEQMNVDVSEVMSMTRIRNVCEARQMFAYWLQTFNGLSLNQIGLRIRTKEVHHTTVIHAIRHIKNLIDTDSRLSAIWNSLPVIMITPFTSLRYRQAYSMGVPRVISLNHVPTNN